MKPRISTNIVRLMLLSAIVLFILTFTMIEPIDVIKLSDAKMYPLYYFLMQPMTVWVIIPLTTLIIIFSPRSFHKVLAALILAFIIEFLPSVIMVNPWLPDQYPYLAEAYWIYLHGEISDVHYLSIVPGLGLSYGVFEIVTNLSPFAVSKAFSLFQAIMLVTMLISLSKKLTDNYTLLPLLFLSFNYFANTTNTFHRSGLHFTYTLTFLYLVLILTMLSYQHLKLRYLIASAIVFSAMTLTYPGSGFILVTIIGAYILLYIAGKAPSLLKLSVMVFSIIFGVWYGYVASIELRAIGFFWDSLLKVLGLELSFEESMTHPFSEGLTPLFSVLTYIRLLIEGGVIVAGCLVALFKYTSAITSRLRGRGGSGVLFVYVLTLASLIAPAPWLLTELSRWSFYKFNHYFLLFSLMSLLHYTYSQSRLRELASLLPIKTKFLVSVAIIFALLLVPLLRYASMPYLHVTTPELYSTLFVHEYFTFNSKCYYLEYPPYIRVLVRGDTLHELTYMYWFENLSVGLYVITDRALTRDGFYLYPQPLQVRLQELENVLTIRGDKVYDNEYNRIYDFRG